MQSIIWASVAAVPRVPTVPGSFPYFNGELVRRRARHRVSLKFVLALGGRPHGTPWSNPHPTVPGAGPPVGSRGPHMRNVCAPPRKELTISAAHASNGRNQSSGGFF